MLELDEVGEKLFNKFDEMQNKTPKAAGANRNDYNNNLPQSNDAGEWDEPDREGLEVNTVPTFNENVFPPVFSNFIRATAESTQTPIDASCMSMIAVLSTALAKKIIIKPHGVDRPWKEPANTFVTTSLAPANRKSAVHHVFVEPIYSFEREERKRAAPLVAEQMADIDAKKERLKKLKTDYSKGKDVTEEIRALARDIEESEGTQMHLPRIAADDITQEKLVGMMADNGEKMSILSAEGGLFDIMAGRYSKGKPNLEIFLKGHTGEQCSVDRMGRTESMESPALTIGLFIQPIVLQDLPPEFAGRGLMARFLYCVPKSFVGARETRPPGIPEQVINEYRNTITRLLQFQPKETLPLRPSEAAGRYLEKVEESFEPRLKGDGDLFDMVDWAGKLLGATMRIVALLHVAEHVDRLPNLPLEISESTMAKGLSLIEYFIPHARKAFDCMAANEDVEQARYLWGKLKTLRGTGPIYRDCFVKQEVWRAVRGKFKTAEQFDTALKILVGRSYVRVVKDQNGEAGRNANLIYLNPLAIMAKINGKTGIEAKNNDYSHFSHEIPPIENELLGNRDLQDEDLFI